MLINPINLYTQYKVAQAQKQTNRHPFFGITCNNLSPLQKDVFTCSFKGEGKINGCDMPEAPTPELCQKANYCAQLAEYDFKLTLGKYMGRINNGEKKGKEPITVRVRRKSPTSIREKVLSKYDKISRKERENFCEKATEQILIHYNIIDKGISPEMLPMHANTSLYIALGEDKVPPYKNEKKFLKKIIDDLKTYGFIKYANNQIPENKAIEQMAKSLHNSTCNDYCDEKGVYLSTKNMFGIKHYVNDMIGGRIILNDGKTQTVQKVLDEIKHASDDGRLKITSVENIVPNIDDKELKHYEYLPEKNIKAFADRTSARYDKKNSKSGYMAIHINFELSDERFYNKFGKTKEDKNIFNGYKGEIQIIDANIETLKEVEDFCYKLKDKKKVPADEYDIFKDYFTKYYDKLNDSEKEAFENYTSSLYLAQRKKSINNEKKNTQFDSIKKLGYEGCFDKELDFRELKKLKEACDKTIAGNHPEITLLKDINFFRIFNTTTDSLRKLILDYNLESYNVN